MRKKNLQNESKAMRLSRIVIMAIIVCAGLSVGSCDKSEGHRREVPEFPDNGGREDPPDTPTDPDSIKRPGVDDRDYDFSKELADASWRYVGAGVDVNYERGGILFSSNRKTTPQLVKITDIDGEDRVTCTIGGVGSDSVVSGASLIVNSVEIALSRIVFKKVAGNTAWYHIVTADESNHVLVIPAD